MKVNYIDFFTNLVIMIAGIYNILNFQLKILTHQMARPHIPIVDIFIFVSVNCNLVPSLLTLKLIVILILSKIRER